MKKKIWWENFRFNFVKLFNLIYTFFSVEYFYSVIPAFRQKFVTVWLRQGGWFYSFKVL